MLREDGRGSGADHWPVLARRMTELVFSKFKWLLTSASARTVEALWAVCGDMLNRFTETECRNCYQHCGYRYT